MSAPLIFPIPIFLSASRPPSSNSTRERAKQRADSRRPKETRRRRRRRRREGGVRENRKEKEKKRPAAICWLRSRPQESHAARYTIIARPNKVTRPPCDCIGPFLDPLRCLRCLVFLPSFLPFILLLLASHSALALGPRLSPRYTHTHTHTNVIQLDILLSMKPSDFSSLFFFNSSLDDPLVPLLPPYDSFYL